MGKRSRSMALLTSLAVASMLSGENFMPRKVKPFQLNSGIKKGKPKKLKRKKKGNYFTYH